LRIGLGSPEANSDDTNRRERQHKLVYGGKFESHRVLLGWRIAISDFHSI
jgi:hypothetical protein